MAYNEPRDMKPPLSSANMPFRVQLDECLRAVVEWSGPARFDEWVEIAVEPTRLGTKSFDLRYRASVDDRAACEATITYVAVKPGINDSIEIPEQVRAVLTAQLPA